MQLPIAFIEGFGSFPLLEPERVPKDEFLIVNRLSVIGRLFVDASFTRSRPLELKSW